MKDLHENENVFVGKDFYEGKAIFKDGLPIFVNKATKQRPPDLQLHTHDFIEVAYVSYGTGIHQIAGEDLLVSKGDLFIINPGVPHRFIEDTKLSHEDFLVFNIAFSPDLINETNLNIKKTVRMDDIFLYSAFFEHNNSVPYYHIHLTAKDMIEIENAYESVYLEYVAEKAGYENIVFSYLIILLVKIFRVITDYDDKNGEYQYKRNFIENSIKYIKENYASCDLNLSEVAMKSFLSKNYFSRLFKDIMNQKFLTYLHNVRISEACKLLKTTNLSISEVMSRVGYLDIKHFNVLFKRIMGMTPTEYKKSGPNK